MTDRAKLCLRSDLVIQPIKTVSQIAAGCLLMATGLMGCGSAPEERRVHAIYDQQTGRLRQLTVDAKADGKPNVFSYMEGTRFLRIEIDHDEDGKIDRWEHYSPEQKLLKVGVSRANDGKEDAWLFQGADGALERMEISTRRDGKANRTEFYEGGRLTRAEEDTDANGRIDKWETYEDAALATVAFDLTGSGKPTHTIDYRSTR